MKYSIIIAITVVACITGVLAISLAGKKKPGRANPATYSKLRNQTFSYSRKALGLPPSTAPLVVLMDINADQDYIITTVAFEDGTASIYLSNGGGYIGGSQRFQTIKSAALSMVTTAAAAQGIMSVTNSYPLPEKDHTTFYIVADDGVYTITALTKDIETPQHPLHSLFAAGQNVITQYRLTQTN